MPMRLTTRAQVSGYRFGLRRMVGALVRRDGRLLHEPVRAQSRAAVVGAVFAALGVAGFAVWGLFSPTHDPKGSALLLARDTGTLHLRIDDRLHPVTDLASARLILGEPVEPDVVPDSALDGQARGPLVGLLGGPGRLPGPDRQLTGPWTVCHDETAAASAGPAVLIGEPGADPAAAAAVTGDRAVLVHTDDETFLLRDGARSRIDPADLPVLRALGLAEAQARPVDPRLIAAVPEQRPLTVPAVPGAGGQPDRAVAGARIGDVIATVGADGTRRHHLVLGDGLQQVSPVVAELVVAGGGRTVAAGAEQIAAVPATAAPLPLEHVPASPPQIVDPAPVLCARWTPPADPGGPGTVTVLAGEQMPVPDRARRIDPATGPAGQVYVRPGYGVFARLRGGGAPGGTVLVTDTGVRHQLVDDAADALGLGAEPATAPWSMVALLPTGPVLRAEDALVARDAPHGRAPDRLLGADD